MKRMKLLSLEKLLCVFLALFLLLSLALIVAVARYNTLHSDEVSLAGYVTEQFQAQPTIKTLFSQTALKVADFYRTWQGTYASAFLQTIELALFAFDFPMWGPILIVAVLILCIFALVFALGRRVLGAGNDVCAALALLLSVYSVNLLPSALEGFFFISANHYAGSFSFLMLLVALLTMLLTANSTRAKNLLTLACIPFVVIIGGSSYPTLPPAVLLLALFIALAAAQRKKGDALRVSLVLIVFLTCAAFNVLAPGNALRMQFSYGVNSQNGFVRTVLLSFVRAGAFLFSRFDLSGAVFALFVLILLGEPIRNSALSFRFPWLFVPFAFCVYASFFASTLYTIGSLGPVRIHNIYFFAKYWLIGFTVVYLYGALIRLLERKGCALRPVHAAHAFLRRHALISALTLLLLIGGVLFLHGPRAVTSYAAVHELRTGVAQNQRVRYEVAYLNADPALIDPTLSQSDLIP